MEDANVSGNPYVARLGRVRFDVTDLGGGAEGACSSECCANVRGAVEAGSGGAVENGVVPLVAGDDGAGGDAGDNSKGALVLGTLNTEGGG